jgi:uncharacterized membrane protein (UPF0136 family)
MRIARTPIALLGAFFIAAGFLLSQYGQSKGIGIAVAFGLIYAAAGAFLVVWSFKPNPH